MKKWIAMLMVFFMVFGLAVPVFANEGTENQAQNGRVEVKIYGVQETSASIGINWIDEGGEWSIPTAKAYISTEPITEENPGTCIDNVWADITGLTPGTTYYVVGEYVIENPADGNKIYRSEQVTFTTLEKEIPELELNVMGIQKTSAYFRIEIKNTAGHMPDTQRVYLSTSPITEENPGECIENLDEYITDLNPGTTYYAVGEGEVEGVTYYTEPITFTTLEESMPLTVTIYPERATHDNIGIGMNVNLEYDQRTEKVFYSEQPINEDNPGQEMKPSKGDPDYIGSYTGFWVSDLKPDTTYYFVGQAEKDGKIYRSEQIKVTTTKTGEKELRYENINSDFKNTIIDGERFEYLSQWDDVIIFQGKNYQFKFAPGALSGIPFDAIYDFGVTIGDANDFKGDASLIKDNEEIAASIHFNHHGKLPATAEITFTLGSDYAGKTMNYYRYNPDTPALELVAEKVVADEEGNITVTQDSCSDYVLTTEKQEEPDNPGDGDTDNPDNPGENPDNPDGDIDNPDEGNGDNSGQPDNPGSGDGNQTTSPDNENNGQNGNGVDQENNGIINPNTGIALIDQYFSVLLIMGVLAVLAGAAVWHKKKN